MNSNKNKIVLITGSSGLLGSNACNILKESYFVTGTYFSYKSKLERIKQMDLDIKDRTACKKLLSEVKPDVIVHCAAITNMDYCETNIQLAHDVNTLGTKNLLDSVGTDCHFIFISTDNIYNNGERFNKEDGKINIINVYGDTKRKAEQIVMKSNCKYTILRTNIFGWHFAGRKTGLLNFIYENLNNKVETTLFKDVFFTPISIPFFINGIINVIENKTTGIFNFAGIERISKLDFGLIIADVFGLDKSFITPISIEEKNFIAKRPKEMSMDSTKISNHAKVPKTVIEQIIELGLPN